MFSEKTIKTENENKEILNKIKIENEKLKSNGFLNSLFYNYPSNVKIMPFVGGNHQNSNSYIQKRLKCLSQKIPELLTNDDVLENLAFEERFIRHFQVFDDSDSVIYD
jgi:DNA-directed RNA polymerase subunit H (RpoH/RPB5)